MLQGFTHYLQTMACTLISAFPFLLFPLIYRAEMRARTLQDVHRDLSLEIRVARQQYKDQADHHRLGVLTFVVGYIVWLLRRHITTARPCTKLNYKMLAPFRIIERINPLAF